MSVTISDFGRATDGTPVKKAVLKNDKLEVHILSYAAIIHRILVADRHGKTAVSYTHLSVVTAPAG